ncbi:MAG TPA: lipid II flippase MurJ [Azospirillaceae bacterium]|nr:lipid II flippase MurJ [Azospirillaceae bacterium]
MLTDYRTVAVWTLVSRITGFCRIIVMGAVLGPTYFANIFQTTAYVPNILFGVLGGSMVGAVLVPPLVRSTDEAVFRRLANGFLGAMLPILLAAALLTTLLATPLLALATAAVDDPQVRHQQQQAGYALLLFLLPQLPLYGIAAIGMAVQQARGRFAIAAAAPAAENIASIAVLGVSALVFGVGHELHEVGTGQLILLGAGTTAAVGVHAAVQLWGAWRAGAPLFPRAGWQDAEVRGIVRVGFASGAYTALQNLVFLMLLVAAGSIPGGAVAFQFGFNFAALPVALVAVPLASAQLPRLSRAIAGSPAAFRSLLAESLAFGRFLTLPAAFLLVALSEPLARAVTFGEMTTDAGVAIVAAGIGGLGLGVFGEASMSLLSSAAYARRKVAAPVWAMALRAVVAAAGTGLALGVMDGPSVLWTLGLGQSAGSLLAAAYLHRTLMRSRPANPPEGTARTRGGTRAFLGDMAIAALSMTAGGAVAFWIGSAPGGQAQAAGGVVVGAAIGGGLYLAIHWVRGSRELASLVSMIRGGPSHAGGTDARSKGIRAVLGPTPGRVRAE